MAAPRPAITPHPMRPAAAADAAGSIFTHWPAATSVFSAKAPIPRAGDSAGPPSVIFWVALAEATQYHGLPLAQERQRPQGARQAMTTGSPGATLATPSPTASTSPAA